MNFEPTNRHILVNPIEEEQEESNSLIMLPDDYKKQESKEEKRALFNCCDGRPDSKTGQ